MAVTPHEVVEATSMVARKFGEDIAQEVCAIYLEKRPELSEPLHWWRRTARFVKSFHKQKQHVREAPRYWTEAEWFTRRPEATPQRYAECWELVDRIPAEVVVQLVLMEGVRGDHTRELMQLHTLRRWAMKYAKFVVGLVVALVPTMAGAQTVVDLNVAKFQWDWTQGTGGVASEFRIKCGPTSGTYPLVTSVSASARQFPVSQVIGGSGTYFCVITAANQYGESAPSGEVFFAAGVTPSIPSNLRVTP